MYSLYKWNPSVTLVTAYLLFGNEPEEVYNTLRIV